MIKRLSKQQYNKDLFFNLLNKLKETNKCILKYNIKNPLTQKTFDKFINIYEHIYEDYLMKIENEIIEYINIYENIIISVYIDRKNENYTLNFYYNNRTINVDILKLLIFEFDFFIIK